MREANVERRKAMADKIKISIEDADAYFAPGNHPMGSAWLAVKEPARREEYLKEAIRQMCAELKTDLTAMAANGTFVPPRYDYAIFERALFIMMRSGAVADGTLSGPKWFGVADDDVKARRSRAEERWLAEEIAVSIE